MKQYAYLCWPPIMKINFQYAYKLNEEQKHTPRPKRPRPPEINKGTWWI